MAKNFVQDGITIEYTASGAVLSGAIVIAGALVAVALNNVAATEIGVASVEGVFELPKTAGTAITQGAAVDYDLSAKEFAVITTPAVGDLVGCGIAWAAAASADTTVLVKINTGAAVVT